jgi:tetratricopeptide (TPR) repeat protein
MSASKIIAILAPLILLIRFATAADVPSAPPTPPKIMWLSDLPERNVKVGAGSFGKGGSTGVDAEPIYVNYLGSPHGLGTHPDCHVEYTLHKKYRTFRGTAAMDSSTEPPSDWPIEFRVLGDGRLLWNSRGMHDKTDTQPCLIDIAGVDTLRLEVIHRPGGSGSKGRSHAVWIEPYVSTDPPSPDLLARLDPKPFERVDTRANFERRVRDLFDKESFSELEPLVKPYRAKDECWVGCSALDTFYKVLQKPRKDDNASWEKHLARLDRWKKAMPESPTPWIALGDSYVHYAWVARGNGYANTITPEGGKSMTERMAAARACFEQAMKLNPPDAEAYRGMMEVLLLEGDSLDDLLKYFDAGRKIAPRYFPFYAALANYLLPKWHGEAGDVAKHAARLRREVGGDLGDEIYFRMAAYYMENYNADEDFLDHTGFKYDQLLPGIRVAQRDYPENNFYCNVGCYLACLGDDKELALQLLPRLDQATMTRLIWLSLGRVEYYRQKFDPQSHANDVARTIAGHVGIVTSIAWLQDGSILGGGEWSRLGLWDAASGEMLSSLEIPSQIGVMAVESSGRMMVASHGQEDYAASTAYLYGLRGQGPPKPLEGHKAGVISVAISRDGRHCATASRDNTARLWTTADLSKPLVLQHPERLFDVAFAGNGKTLFTTTFNGGLWQWDVLTGKPRGGPLVGVNQGPPQCHVCCFPRSNRLVTASAGGPIRLWNMATRKFAEVQPAGFAIQALAVSPDEQWIAVGRRTGEVEVLRADSLHIARRYKEHCGTVQTVSFSPDSRMLASGSFDGTIKLWPIWKLAGAPVKQAADGSIRLAAGDAQIAGTKLLVEGGHEENLGNWDDAKDRPTWTVEVQKAGDYVPELIYSASPGDAGGKIEISCGDAKSQAAIDATEGWSDYRSLVLPALDIKAGTVKIAVAATQKPHGYVMNLRWIILKPVK